MNIRSTRVAKNPHLPYSTCYREGKNKKEAKTECQIRIASVLNLVHLSG